MKVTITSPEFVGRYYDMNPETEDLLPNGTLLKPGMIVLIENPSIRQELSDIPLLEEFGRSRMDRIRMFNRWGTVQHVVEEDRRVFVTVEYVDGTKRILKTGLNEGWYVKKDSLPKEIVVNLSDKPGTDDEETITFEQLGTGVRVTVPKSEITPDNPHYENVHVKNEAVIGEVASVSEDEDGLKVEGTLTDEGMAYVKADADATMDMMESQEDYGPTNSGVDEDDEDEDDISSAPSLFGEGPLVRAMRTSSPPLREKRTVTKTEVVEIYGMDRPFRYGRRF